MVQDRHAQLGRQLHNGNDHRLGTGVFVVKLDADKPALSYAAADFLQRLSPVAGIDVAVAEHPAGETVHRFGCP